MKHRITLLLMKQCIITFALAFCFSFQAFSKPKGEPVFIPRKLDGIKIKAVETYITPEKHEVAFGLGVYPFDPFYNGFSLSGGYTYTFSNALAWEALHASYTFSVEKDLTSELAEDFGVSPELIERLNFIFSTNAIYTPIYGKFVLLRNVIYYFRTSFLGGLGLVTTSFTAKFAVNLGVRFEILVKDSFSWRLDVRDAVAFKNGITNYVTFSLGTGIYF